MKKLLGLFLFLVSLGNAYAQGTLEFTAHLTSTMSQAFGDGSFSLSGDLLAYNLRTDYDFNPAEIHSPITAGTNAPLIFNLRLRGCDPGLGEYRGGCFFRGNFTLSEEQISELVSEQCYLIAFSPSTPPIVMSGQIIQVPEPTGLTLIVLGIGFGYLRFLRQPAQC